MCVGSMCILGLRASDDSGHIYVLIYILKYASVALGETFCEYSVIQETHKKLALIYCVICCEFVKLTHFFSEIAGQRMRMH